ncbi:T-complex protein 1, alpha subunit [Vavraia culicis subsp. floridensis]|uniref:T-complex protein 1, alpha subunit n=1 Tax=Vavraia culicis (isolate floridensis) TaxID=948595 RepID=L2GVJ8_VAVCU|nr:T-complex protein 1, alpha subunit [Vavraia culicis subsp. floridensis]ELA47659.1 T-complex protein 1, alpha subunit [Vavraia culicis subsp. floridensis]
MSETIDPFTGTTRTTAEAARNAVTKAVLTLTNAVKTSYGALGLDKMCIGTTGDVLITNDGATILTNMDVKDPIANLIIELSRQQDVEMGDGTTGVVLLASALIERGNELIKRGLHPSIVVSGYKMAFRESQRFIKEKLENKGVDINAVVDTTLSSKVVYSKHFNELTLRAVKAVEHVDFLGKKKYKIQNINILKKEGGQMADSFAVEGYAINAQPCSKEMPTNMKKVKVALLDFDLGKVRLPLNVNIVVDDPDMLEKNRKNEISIALDRVNMILDSADVILSSRNIDDFCVKPIIERKKIGIKRVPMKDLKVLSKALNISISKTEEIEVAEIDEISVEQLAHENYTIFKFGKNLSSIVLRGGNDTLLEEMERSVNDGLCAIKRTLECESVLAGGGAFECALSIFLEEYAFSLPGKEAAAIFTYSESLLVIPKTLAMNAGLDANQSLSELRAFQNNGNQEGMSECFDYGLDIRTGEIVNNIKRGIVEPGISKIRALRAATEVAISILRIDEVIKIPEAPKKQQRDMCG